MLMRGESWARREREESMPPGVSEAGFMEGGLRGIMPDWEKQVHLQKEGTAVSC